MNVEIVLSSYRPLQIRPFTSN